MYIFGDGFDMYVFQSDIGFSGYWDATAPSYNDLVGGRFAGSRAIQNYAGTFTKNSGANDAIHHICAAYWSPTITAAPTSYGMYIQFRDGATAQCTIVFNYNGSITLTSGTATGAVLATFSGGIQSASTWYQYEVEVVIHNTAGSFTVRRNGNLSNDFQATALNTRTTANNFANSMVLGGGGFGNIFYVDDFLWRSDPTSVSWAGDVRCYTRHPSSDVVAQLSRPTATFSMPAIPAGVSTSTTSQPANRVYFSSFTGQGGAVATASLFLSAGWTGNMKCALYAATTAGLPGAVVQVATAPLNNPAPPSASFTFSPPVSITTGTLYFLAFCVDVSTPTMTTYATLSPFVAMGLYYTGSYATFPVASPTGLTVGANLTCFLVVTPTANANYVSDTIQDATSSYLADNVVGHNDLYGVTGLPVTPANTIAVTTRALVQKTDFGTRTGAVQLKSGTTTVQSTAPSLTAGGWTWLYRTDGVDPNTGAAWTATAVNNVQIGPVVVT